MKKLFILFVVLIFSLTIYADYQRGADAVTKTETELSEKFVSEIGISLIDDYLITYRQLESGEEIFIVDEDEDYYYFRENDFLLFVNRKAVRTEDDEPFQPYKAYAVNDVNVYRDCELTQAWYTLTYDTPVTVIDEYEDALVIQLKDGSVVYMEKDSVKPREAVDVNESSSTSSVSETTTPEEPTTEESSSEEDGNVVVVIHSEQPPLSSPDTRKGTIRVNTDAYVSKISIGDKLNVIDQIRDDALILINHTTANLPISNIWIRSSSSYVSWVGYLDEGQSLYEDYGLEKEAKKSAFNEEVVIVGEIEDRYLVETDENDILFIEQEKVAKMAKNASTSVLAPTPVVETTVSATETTENTTEPTVETVTEP